MVPREGKIWTKSKPLHATSGTPIPGLEVRWYTGVTEVLPAMRASQLRLILHHTTTAILTMIVGTPATTTNCTSNATTVTGWDTTRISVLYWDRPASNNGSNARTASKNAKDGRLSDRVANRGATVVNKVSKGTARVQSQTPG